MRLADHHSCRLQLLSRSDDDGTVCRTDSKYEESAAKAASKPLPLTHCKSGEAIVGADLVAR